MKRVILTTAACLFLSSSGFAQSTSVDSLAVKLRNAMDSFRRDIETKKYARMEQTLDQFHKYVNKQNTEEKKSHSTLESFFNHYSEEDGFTYVYTGKKDRDYDTYSKKPCSIKFSKTLTCNTIPYGFVESLKEILIKKQFELVEKVKTDSNRSETYRIESDEKEFEQVKLIVTGERVHVRWVSGKLKG